MNSFEPYLKNWYEELAQGNLAAVKCKCCGAVQFPPVPVCNTCSGMEMEPVKISGRGKLTTFGFSVTGIYPYTEDEALLGHVELEEGMPFAAPVVDAETEPEDLEALFDRLPVPIHLEIARIDDEYNIYFPVIKLDEEI